MPRIRLPTLVPCCCALALSAAAQTGDLVETRHSVVEDWTITSGVLGQTFGYCAATREADGHRVRLGWDESAWTLAIDIAAPAGVFTGRMRIDSGITHDLPGHSDGDWSYMSLGSAALAAFRAGWEARIELGEEAEEMTLPLEGTTAMTDALRDCMDTQERPLDPDA